MRTPGLSSLRHQVLLYIYREHPYKAALRLVPTEVDLDDSGDDDEDNNLLLELDDDDEEEYERKSARHL